MNSAIYAFSSLSPFILAHKIFVSWTIDQYNTADIVVLCGTTRWHVESSLLLPIWSFSLGLNTLEQKEASMPIGGTPSRVGYVQASFLHSFRPFCFFFQHSVHAFLKTSSILNSIFFIIDWYITSISGHIFY